MGPERMCMQNIRGSELPVVEVLRGLKLVNLQSQQHMMLL